MPITYRALSALDRRAMVEQRLRGLESEHYDHELTRLAVEGLPAEERATEIERVAGAQAHLEVAIRAFCVELDDLDAVSSAPAE